MQPAMKPVCADHNSHYREPILCSHKQLLPAAAKLQRTSSFGGVVPVALTNTHATADEATRGAPVTGPGIAEPFPSDAQDAAKPSPSAAMDTGEQAPQVSVADTASGLHADTLDQLFLAAAACPEDAC